MIRRRSWFLLRERRLKVRRPGQSVAFEMERAVEQHRHGVACVQAQLEALFPPAPDFDQLPHALPPLH